MTNPVLLRKGGSSKALKALFWIAVDFVSAFLVFFLYIVKPFKPMKLFLFIDDKIGHLSPLTDLFLRRIQNGILKTDKNSYYVGIASKKQPNMQLFNMFKRRLSEVFNNKIKIIQIHEPDIIQAFLRAVFSERSLFGKSVFFQKFFTDTYNVPEFTKFPSSVSFSSDEETKGKKLLEKIGIKKNFWFICFHARDPSYLTHTSTVEEWKHYNYRDCNINNYLKAAEYIASKKGFAVRMGHLVSKKMPTKNPRIIDYATKFRTDFSDIYLVAKCKFFLANTSGLSVIGSTFNRPVAYTNFIPIKYVPHRSGDIFIPKKIWSKKEKRFLTFSEMLRFKQEDYTYTEDFEKVGLIPIENTPDEILELAKEMNERLDRKFKYTKEDEKMQKKFWKIFRENYKLHPFPYIEGIRIGAKFLRENKNLLA